MAGQARYPLLDSLRAPADLHGLDVPGLTALAAELREFLVQTVSTRGGHFAAGLGIDSIGLDALLAAQWRSADIPLTAEADSLLLARRLALALLGRFDRHVDPLWDHGHIKFFSPRTLTRLIEEAGFVDAVIRRPDLVPQFACSMVAAARKP